MQEVAIPHASLLLGKGVLDENRAGFVGTYCGGASDPAVQQSIENADVVINVGVRFTDTITGDSLIICRWKSASISSRSKPG